MLQRIQMMLGPVPATIAMEMRVSLISRCWTTPCRGCSCISRTWTWSIYQVRYCFIAYLIDDKILNIAFLRKLCCLISIICAFGFFCLPIVLLLCRQMWHWTQKTMSGSGRWTQQDNILTLPALSYHHHQTFAPFPLSSHAVMFGALQFVLSPSCKYWCSWRWVWRREWCHG